MSATTSRTHTYREVDVSVPGGALHAGVWEPDTPTGGTVVAVHGVTAHHGAFAWLADALPGTRVVAPDLRGRGGSADLPGPYGMPRHADDVAALAEHLDVRRAVVVGHSMGGFVSLVLAHRHPDLVDRLVLVDGGLPLHLPPDVDLDTAMAAVLGPAVQRLSMTFPDHAAYRDFWRDHPAFTADWGPALEEYFDRDVEEHDGLLRPAARIQALAEDQHELFAGASLLEALDGLAVPTTFLRAPAGLLGGPPLYAPEHLAAWVERVPRLTPVEVPDVNHYTIVMTDRGARAVAEQVRPGGPGGRTVDVTDGPHPGVDDDPNHREVVR